MIKKIFIFLLIFTSSVCAEVVKDIKIIGNERISEETIKVYGDIELNKDLSIEDMNNITKNLYNTNFFENVLISLENGKLSINVKEYPIINSIDILGEKSKTVKNSILEKLKLQSKNSFISSYLNDDIILIKKIYASAGYNFAKIDSKIEKFSNNRLNLIFNLDKGERNYIKKINFIGDKKFSDKKLRDIIVSEEHKFWKIISKNTFYSESNIDLDKRLLINYYKSLGYYDAQVLSNSAEIFNNGNFNLTYTINAGNRFKINKISTNLQEVIDKDIFAELTNVYTRYVGKYYSPFSVKKILDEVDRIILDNDLQFVEHSVNEILELNNIEIKINIFEGKKEIVEKINVFGNSVTDESVIRSELVLDEGDPLNMLKIDQSIAKLKSRNIFGEVKSDIKEGSRSNQKIINISVEEKPTGEISAGAGIGTNGGSFAFNVSENNWLGKGLNLTTSLDVNPETLSGSFSVTDPNYNFTGNSINYFVSNTKTDSPDSGYQNNIISTGIGLSFEQYRDIFLSPNLNFSYDDLKVESTASSALKKQAGNFTDISFGYGISSDKRNRVYNPSDGYIMNFNQLFPIYADAPYIKNSFSVSKYQQFTNDLIGAFKFYSSAINGLNDEDVRISKRLKIPSSRLRGFEYGKIGPKDGKDYVGGNYAAAVNLEMNLPNLLPESTKTDIGIFLDFGNLWHIDYDKNIDDSNKLRSTVGISTNWTSPVGPMSFIFSQNLSKANTDIDESFNFRLGTTF